MNNFEKSNLWHDFKTNIKEIELPKKFTFPFYYEPHPLAKIAAAELQEFLINQTDWKHNFGLNPMDTDTAIGKMFGVLVVENLKGEIGYLCGFSGKIAQQNNLPGFVPPIFDMLDPKGFFLTEEAVLNTINSNLEKLLQDPNYALLQKQLFEKEENNKKEIIAKKKFYKEQKNERKKARENFSGIADSNEYQLFQEDLIKQSLRDKHDYSVWLTQKSEELKEYIDRLTIYENQIHELKTERSTKSNALQQKLFDQYWFLNGLGTLKNVRTLFEAFSIPQPPAASGDCAAPKLLQFAFENNYKPIALAEFWWGQSPNSEIRQHGYFYPACKSKCEPILNFMLEGIQVDNNPLLENPAEHLKIEIIYEDEALIVINKPAELLSVPGIYIQDSVYTRIKEKYPKATGPLIVHRLDMATSGLLVLAKNKESYTFLQKQFIKRTVKKRYIALLEGIIQENDGVINLPLRLDLDDRPRQLVCYEFGKNAETKWEVIQKYSNRTLVYFWPITGRTHQLRVHSAHSSGLNCPIVGDDLYGTKDKRLYLHANYLEFVHPITNETMCFECEADF